MTVRRSRRRKGGEGRGDIFHMCRTPCQALYTLPFTSSSQQVYVLGTVTILTLQRRKWGVRRQARLVVTWLAGCRASPSCCTAAATSSAKPPSTPGPPSSSAPILSGLLSRGPDHYPQVHCQTLSKGFHVDAMLSVPTLPHLSLCVLPGLPSLCLLFRPLKSTTQQPALAS